MSIRLGHWFEFAAGLGGLYLKAPLLGSVFVGPGLVAWDR